MKNGCSDSRSRGDLVCSLFPHPEQRIKTWNTKMEGSLFRVFNCFQIMRFWLESSFWDSKSLVYSANWLLLEPRCNKSNKGQHHLSGHSCSVQKIISCWKLWLMSSWQTDVFCISHFLVRHLFCVLLPRGKKEL